MERIMNAKNPITRNVKLLLAKVSLPRSIRIGDLRHTCATMLLKMDQHLKYVRGLMGHATIGITFDTYSHVLPRMGGRLADAMDDAMGS